MKSRGQNEAKRSRHRDQVAKCMSGYQGACLRTVKAVADRGEFDRLRDLSFDVETEHLPDYTDGTTVAYYQLRYAVAYAFEYYCMYRLALAWMEEPDSMCVVSLGCGSGLDRYSLSLALFDEPRVNRYYVDIRGSKDAAGKARYIDDRTRWLGVDIATWGAPSELHSPDFPSHGNAIDILDGGAIEYFERHAMYKPFCDRALFLFPRMLSELDDETMDKLDKAIRGACFSRDSIIIAIANRSGIESDELRNSKKVIDAFVAAGFTHVEPLPSHVRDSLKLCGDAVVAPIGSKDVASEMTLYRVQNEHGEAVRIREASQDIKGFFLLSNVYDYLRLGVDGHNELSRACREHAEDHGDACGSACPSYNPKKKNCPLAMNPVTTTSQMSFQMVKLTRDHDAALEAVLSDTPL